MQVVEIQGPVVVREMELTVKDPVNNPAGVPTREVRKTKIPRHQTRKFIVDKAGKWLIVEEV